MHLNDGPLRDTKNGCSMVQGPPTAEALAGFGDSSLRPPTSTLKVPLPLSSDTELSASQLPKLLEYPPSPKMDTEVGVEGYKTANTHPRPGESLDVGPPSLSHLLTCAADTRYFGRRDPHHIFSRQLGGYLRLAPHYTNRQLPGPNASSPCSRDTVAGPGCYPQAP